MWKVSDHAEKLEFSHTCCWNWKNGTATLKNCLMVSKKLNIHLKKISISPTLATYPREWKYLHSMKCTWFLFFHFWYLCFLPSLFFLTLSRGLLNVWSFRDIFFLSFQRTSFCLVYFLYWFPVFSFIDFFLFVLVYVFIQ